LSYITLQYVVDASLTCVQSALYPEK